MAGTNEILPFALGGAANIMPQPDYASLSARANGFQAGVAQSNQVNKVLRQAAFMARVLSQWAIDQTGGSILDNGDEANAKALLSASVQAIVNAILGINNYATNPQLAAQVANLTSLINNEAVLRAQADAAENAVRSTADAGEASARASAITTEANTRFAQDQAIVALLAGYMQRGTSKGNYARLVTPVTVSSNYQLDLPFTTSVFGIVMVTGSANISTGLLPAFGGAFLNLYLDAVLITTEGTQGPMSNSFTLPVAAGGHVVSVIFGPQAAPITQAGLSLSYLFVES